MQAVSRGRQAGGTRCRRDFEGSVRPQEIAGLVTRWSSGARYTVERHVERNIKRQIERESERERDRDREREGEKERIG